MAEHRRAVDDDDVGRGDRQLRLDLAVAGRYDVKGVGDKVRVGDPLVEVVTDKVNAEVPSPFEGTLTELYLPRRKKKP